MAILEAEWQGLIVHSWNSKIPLVFDHVVLPKTLGVHHTRDLHTQISWRMELWEGGLFIGLVGTQITRRWPGIGDQ